MLSFLDKHQLVYILEPNWKLMTVSKVVQILSSVLYGDLLISGPTAVALVSWI